MRDGNPSLFRCAALRLLAIAFMASVGSLPATAFADTISTGSASPAVGSVLCESGFSPPQCNYQAFDTTGDVAFSGGPAAPAVSSSTIPGFSTIHDPVFINDGLYGNGKSWISNGSGDWLKIDLGVAQMISQIRFGRDRLGGFDDRDPGQFLIDFALSDAVYANGNDTNDATEYSNAVDSSTLGFSGSISFAQTIVVTFDAPITARYVKMTFTSTDVAIDEVEVFVVQAVPALQGAGLLTLCAVLVSVGAFLTRRSEAAITGSASRLC